MKWHTSFGWVTALGLALGSQVRAAEPGPDASLERLLRHDCGSCHGMRLTGGLGPPLTPAALAQRTTAELSAVILDGRPGTAMPGWRGILTVRDVQRLVARLQGDDRDEHALAAPQSR